jgi:hypothetical protein
MPDVRERGVPLQGVDASPAAGLTACSDGSGPPFTSGWRDKADLLDGHMSKSGMKFCSDFGGRT